MFKLEKTGATEATKEDADLGQTASEAQVFDLDSGLSRRFEQGPSNQTDEDQMNHQFLFESLRTLTMPVSDPQSLFEIPVEGLDSPALMVEVGELLGRKHVRIDQGSHQTPTAEAFSLDVDHSDNESLIARPDPTQIVAGSEIFENFGTMSGLGRDEKVSAALSNSQQRIEIIETIVDQDQVSFSQSMDELADQFVIGGRGFRDSIEEGCSTDQLEDTGELGGYGPQAFLASMGTEPFPEGGGFGKGQSGMVDGEQPKSIPALVSSQSIQFGDQAAEHPQKTAEGKNDFEPDRRRAR